MVVGENISVIADNKTGTKTSLFKIALRHIAKKTVKEIISEIFIKRRPAKIITLASSLKYFCCAYIDNCRFNTFSQIGKRAGNGSFYCCRCRNFRRSRRDKRRSQNFDKRNNKKGDQKRH